MGLLRTKTPPPAFGAATVKAAAGAAGRPGAARAWYDAPSTATSRALSIPTVARGLGMITSTIGGLEFRQYRQTWNGTGYDREYMPAERWMIQPDPRTTRQFVVAQLVRDLVMVGRSFLYVTARYETGYPSSFTWLPAEAVTTPDQPGPEWIGPADTLEYHGVELDRKNVVQFLNPMPGINYTGARAIDIAYRLDEAAKRFSSVEIAAGYLQQLPGTEPLSAEELTDLASAWAEARQNKAIGALNAAVTFNEFSSNPSTLQLLEGRQHAALELARVMQVPPWLVGLAVGGMSYSNTQDSRKEFYVFGIRGLVDALEQGFSSNQVIPDGRFVELDVGAYIRETEDQQDQQDGQP